MGLFLANAPAVLLGNAFAQRLPLPALRWTAAAGFVAAALFALSA